MTAATLLAAAAMLAVVVLAVFSGKLIRSFSVVPYKAWLLLVAGPVLFLLAIVACSIFLIVRGVPASQVPERVTALAPHILLAVELCLVLLMTRFVPQVRAAWVMPEFSKALADITVGLFAGVLLAVTYLYWLAPWLETLQRAVGDYVPPGAVLPTVSGNIGLFFIANVLLAPLVEETLYRGATIPTAQHTRWRRLGSGAELRCLWSSALGWRFLVHAADRSGWRGVCRFVSVARRAAGTVRRSFGTQPHRDRICLAHLQPKLARQTCIRPLSAPGVFERPQPEIPSCGSPPVSHSPSPLPPPAHDRLRQRGHGPGAGQGHAVAQPGHPGGGAVADPGRRACAGRVSSSSCPRPLPFWPGCRCRCRAGRCSVSARFRQAPSPRRAATLQHRVKRQIPCLITLP